MTRILPVLAPILAGLFTASLLRAQEAAADALHVFLDCSGFGCDEQFIRSEIDWVAYVRDRQDADVHLLITRQQTGGGGWEYTLEFLGQGVLTGQSLDLRYTSPQTATEDEEREGLVRTMRFGLAAFVAARNPGAEGLEVRYEPANGAAPRTTAGIDDPWDFWTFSIRLGGSFDGEARRKSWDIDGSVEAERVTEQWKFELETQGEQGHGRFEIDSVTTVTSEEHEYGLSTLLVRSLGAHWSAGGRAGAESSTRLNQNFSVRLAPAIEYSVFPYQLFNRRQLTFLYSVGLSHFDYREITLFGKLSETLPEHSLRGTLELNQPWGEAEISLTGRQFLHDGERFSLDLFNRLDVRVLRGLSVSLFGGVSYIRDQLFLPAGDADPEEILLDLRELETNYDYFLSLGFSYTFGSIYNTVVNPRF
ncbi:MAG TPA: hypothetical protein VF167_13040 [Longimicrobiaceae bacterium]